MANNNDTMGKTLFVVVALCLVCSIIVAGSAVGLKPTQEQQRLLDKQRNVLEVSGLLGGSPMSGEQIRTLYAERIDAKLVDLTNGSFVDEDPDKFDRDRALKDSTQSIALERRDDPSGLRRRPNLAQIFLVRDADRNISQLILPINGNGLWSMMYAFVAVEIDGNTVVGINYYDQGETPGLGDEVTSMKWRKLWPGKKLFDGNGKVAIHLIKGRADPSDPHAVDGVSGATLTSRGVSNMFNFWMGDLGYGPFLKKVREGLLTQGEQNHG